MAYFSLQDYHGGRPPPTVVPPFEERMTTSNDILSDQDDKTARLMLEDEIKDITLLKNTIASIKDVLEGLILQLQSRTGRVDRLRTGIAPHKKLPAEVLANIFVATFRPHEAFDLTPLPLTQVCSRWRKIAFAAPQIWSHIFVDALNSRRVNFLREVQIVEGRAVSISRS